MVLVMLKRKLVNQMKFKEFISLEGCGCLFFMVFFVHMAFVLGTEKPQSRNKRKAKEIERSIVVIRGCEYYKVQANTFNTEKLTHLRNCKNHE